MNKYISCIKRSLYVVLVLIQASDLAHGSSPFSLEEIDIKSHTRNYNSLPSVDQADRDAKNCKNFDSFLLQAGNIVKKYEAESMFGLRLIHRHFKLGQNQVMVETYKNLEETGPSLVTSAYPIKEAIELGATPASWIFGPNNIQVFETTTDDAAKEGIQLAKRNPSFFDEMESLIRKSEVQSLVSLSINKKQSLPASENQIYLEGSFEEFNLLRNTSIVRLWDSFDKLNGTIITSWGFGGPKQVACISRCYPTMNGHKYVTNHCTML